ncbi:unnamed protein product [Lathyrus oleraceus]
MPTITNFYTIQDASHHKTEDDCWIIVDGKVYDVTRYLEDHPGGDDVILAATGRDATDDFEDAGHSKSARELMEKYYIGEFDTSSTISTKKVVVLAENEALQQILYCLKHRKYFRKIGFFHNNNKSNN